MPVGMSMLLWALLILSPVPSPTGAPYFSVEAGLPRKARDWSKIDLARLEEEWEVGDEEDELITADEELYQLMERQKQEANDELDKAMARGDGSGNPSDIERLAREAQRAGKPAMIFTKVRKERAPKVEQGGWNWDALAELCEEWQYRLEFKMVDITCYPMEPDGVLVTVQRGWHGQDAFDYLSHQDILEEITWDGQTVELKDDPDEF